MTPLSTQQWKMMMSPPLNPSFVDLASHRIAGTGRQGEQSVVAVVPLPPWLGWTWTWTWTWTSSLGAALRSHAWWLLCYHLHAWLHSLVALPKPNRALHINLSPCMDLDRSPRPHPRLASSSSSSIILLPRLVVTHPAWLALVRSCFDSLTAPSKIGREAQR
jgi:hypothetical protein